MTNLFGRGKEPFWQQASTNLVKFVILLHQTLDDYVTLFQVYEHVINPDKLRARIAEGERRFARQPPAHRRGQDASTCSRPRCKAGSWHDDETGDADLGRLVGGSRGRAQGAEHPVITSNTRRRRRAGPTRWRSSRPSSGGSRTTGCASSRSCARPSSKASACSSRCSTTTRGSSTPSARRRTRTIPARIPTAIHGTPLPPLADLIEQGKVVALNFPIAMNPGLARALGTMLKQDFQRAVLNRIHRR